MCLTDGTAVQVDQLSPLREISSRPRVACGQLPQSTIMLGLVTSSMRWRRLASVLVFLGCVLQHWGRAYAQLGVKQQQYYRGNGATSHLIHMPAILPPHITPLIQQGRTIDSNAYYNMADFRSKSCETNGKAGKCMFVWECIKNGGQHVGMCMVGFMFGSCCSLDKASPLYTNKENHSNIHGMDLPDTSKDPNVKPIMMLTPELGGMAGIVTTPSYQAPTRPSTEDSIYTTTSVAETESTQSTGIKDRTDAPEENDDRFPAEPLHSNDNSANEDDITTTESTTESRYPGTLWDRPGKPITIKPPVPPPRPTRPPKPVKPIKDLWWHYPSKPSKSTTKRVYSETTTTTTTTPVPTTTTPYTTTTTTSTTTTTTSPIPITTQSTSSTTLFTSALSGPQASSSHTTEGECGTVKIPPRPEGRIVNGTTAQFGEWPWQASVRRISFFGFSSNHRCGGALLNSRWVATAGHCVDDLLVAQIRIRVGEYDFSSVLEPHPYVERAVIRKVVHPRYDFFTYEYDLALVKMEESVTFAPHISPICLPGNDDLLIGEYGTITGWGRLSEHGTLPSKLQEAAVPIMSNEKCRKLFLRGGRKERIPDIFLCAGYDDGGRDSCQGDSGGPLQVRGRDGRFFLAGIISWGIGCAEASLPGVCTRISKFVPFILQTVT